MAQHTDVIRDTDAAAIALAKSLLRGARFGALATIEPGTGTPMASRVGVAADADGAPLILVSLLAAHTRAIQADSRCSLLVGEPGKGDPLAHPRLTVVCRCERIAPETPSHERAARRYLSRNPKARLYAGLGDFSFFRLVPERASLNAGFGKAFLLEAREFILKSPAVAELAAIEGSAVEHMNRDHGAAIEAYARHYAGAKRRGWKMTGCDIEGVDLARGEQSCRIPFLPPLRDAGELRDRLVQMTNEALGTNSLTK